MKRVFAVSKTYIHRGNHRHRPDTKKHWFIYYYNDEGKFTSERVSYLKAMYYKAHRYHRTKFTCLECLNEFIGIVKSKNQVLECPYCHEEDVLEGDDIEEYD